MFIGKIVEMKKNKTTDKNCSLSVLCKCIMLSPVFINKPELMRINLKRKNPFIKEFLAGKC
jgi:hypothetical protein